MTKASRRARSSSVLSASRHHDQRHARVAAEQRAVRGVGGGQRQRPAAPCATTCWAAARLHGQRGAPQQHHGREACTTTAGSRPAAARSGDDASRKSVSRASRGRPRVCMSSSAQRQRLQAAPACAPRLAKASSPARHAHAVVHAQPVGHQHPGAQPRDAASVSGRPAACASSQSSSRCVCWCRGSPGLRSRRPAARGFFQTTSFSGSPRR
jgi:hypothetical protein